CELRGCCGEDAYHRSVDFYAKLRRRAAGCSTFGRIDQKVDNFSLNPARTRPDAGSAMYAGYDGLGLKQIRTSSHEDVLLRFNDLKQLHN
ncbi:MAG: hypothetical protein Q4C34_09495, partial [Bacteroidales bacterium]|nr:hypothetical protein [Bacteroidales bacterium]